MSANLTAESQAVDGTFWRHKRAPYLVCSLSALFYLYEFFLRVMPSAVTHELMHDFGTRAAGLGMLASMFYWGYTPMQVPAGLLLDRFGPRKILTLSVLLCALFSFLFGQTTSLTVASLSRFVIGVSSSFAYLGALILASRWFPPKRFAMIAGLVQVLGCAGALIGLAPVAAAAQQIGWRGTMHVAAVISCVLSVLFWTIIRDYPHNYPYEEAATNFSLLGQLKAVCANTQVWWTALLAFCTWGPITVFGDLWGTPFLAAKYGLTSVQAASTLSVIWVGIAIGGPTFGWWSNVIQSRCKPLAWGAIIGALSATALIYCDLSLTMMIFCIFCFGVAASAQAVTFGLLQDLVPPKVAGTAVGFNNMAIIFGGITLQPLVSTLLDLRLSNSTAYTANDYQSVFVILPIIFLMGIIISTCFVRETHCQHQYEI